MSVKVTAIMAIDPEWICIIKKCQNYWICLVCLLPCCIFFSIIHFSFRPWNVYLKLNRPHTHTRTTKSSFGVHCADKNINFMWTTSNSYYSFLIYYDPLWTPSSAFFFIYMTWQSNYFAIFPIGFYWTLKILNE